MTDRNANAARVFAARSADAIDGDDLVRARQHSEEAHRASSARMTAFKHLPKDGSEHDTAPESRKSSRRSSR